MSIMIIRSKYTILSNRDGHVLLIIMLLCSLMAYSLIFKPLGRGSLEELYIGLPQCNFKMSHAQTPGAYCIKLLPEKNSDNFLPMVNWCLPEFSDFTRVFSPVKVYAMGPWWTFFYGDCADIASRNRHRAGVFTWKRGNILIIPCFMGAAPRLTSPTRVLTPLAPRGLLMTSNSQLNS